MIMVACKSQVNTNIHVVVKNNEALHTFHTSFSVILSHNITEKVIFLKKCYIKDILKV